MEHWQLPRYCLTVEVAGYKNVRKNYVTNTINFNGKNIIPVDDFMKIVALAC